ncbi:muramoyltetrapeptide carboxypeptidase [Sphingomonas gellani]|uniref:Muramoyltetrapeptide carboxypeptidase n=1 Tax=Sphingomonas gellani TaxID=1166340 RepID=A0A1H8G4W7_9SPHN|nr:LD-carboxypeptidase [Sphingomonas gellani]SEN38805.1 muramoyltetrapeptide carboxypeptidase [Sphingomonas gellani]
MRIGICAPARPIDRIVEAKLSALAAISFPDVDLVFHPQCYASEGHFAGSDAVRAAALLELANDPAFDAIWFARGGYGSNRILHQVMPQLGPAARHKTYLGYSDNGFLLAALYARRIGRPVHGPMPSEVNRDDGGACVSRALAWLARGDRGVLEPSLGTRPAAAFNIAILDALIGTPWLPDLTDHVLMVEEVSEPMYRIDRMLFTITHATQLKGIAGVRLGMIKDVIANDPPWQGTPDEMIRRWCTEGGVPYLGPALIGHDRDNRVVPFGLA